MPERTMSFSYDATHTREWYENWFRRLAAARGLQLVGTTTAAEPICTPEHIEESVVHFWDDDDLAKLRQGGKLDLPAAKIDKLCSPVTIKTDTYSDPNGSMKVVAAATEGNEFPCIGAWVWLEDEVKLLAGFLTVEAEDRAEIDAIAEEFLAATGRESPA
jgi:hypothetical protein